MAEQVTGVAPARGPQSKTAGLRSAYERDGFVLAKRVFSSNNLAVLSEALQEVLTASLGEGSDSGQSLEDLVLECEARDHNFVYKAAQSVGSSAATYQLLGSSNILDVISAVTGYQKANLHLMPLYLVIQLPSDERFDYTWHQDGSYYPWCKEFLTLWFPVNRGTKRDTGTISLIPGSQQKESRSSQTYFRHGYFRQIESAVPVDEEAKEEILETELGDCCVMDGNTVHRSVANRSSTPRIAGVLRMANLSAQQPYERERFYCVHKS